MSKVYTYMNGMFLCLLIYIWMHISMLDLIHTHTIDTFLPMSVTMLQVEKRDEKNCTYSLPPSPPTTTSNFPQLSSTHTHIHCFFLHKCKWKKARPLDQHKQQRQWHEKESKSEKKKEKKNYMWKQPLECWLSGWLIAKHWVAMELTTEIKIG